VIVKSNFEKLLEVLGFSRRKNIYSKSFLELDCELKVDLEKEELIYPEEKGLIVNERQTCNFASNENFVVFECVYRLLDKGYKPEHIELEPKWKVGHGASGGRADILVKDNLGAAFLIIECKTYDDEFDTEWKNTQRDGGQLFSYARQITSTQYLCLYSSTLTDDKIAYKNIIITLNDNIEYLKSLKNPLSYSKATDVKSLYEAWSKTYNSEYETQGIFEKSIGAYEIGKKKYSVDDLKIVNNDDIQKKYHEFATILRQHNVSGRENAFDKLVNLFLAKIVDEIENKDELRFYWKGFAFDDYYSLQDRIQKLYKDGMQKFLGEEVTYIDNNAINDAFRLFKKDPDATKETILQYFRQLKFFTNNDFAFLDVHNEKLFYQNSVILLKIVKMLQDIRLKTEEQNQFLGDLFEGFLDQGIKQSEGQFFTPTPIVKFLVSSLPLEQIMKQNKDFPKIIDYACGAGHFLNEYATQIQKFVDRDQLKNYYKEIVGIEKEYRLSKVSKVSAFMYGQDEIRIIYGDALTKHKQIKDGVFSILVANPPYSVKGFLEMLSDEEKKAFEISKVIDAKNISTNSSIECFFVERAKQLLAPNGVAAIILPVSVLNNKSGIYVKTRELLLKYFDIIAIAEFGSSTFGKTGTNTVTMFLRRKKENPSLADHYKNRVEAWFSVDFEKDSVFEDKELLLEYCNYISVSFDDYKSLLNSKPNVNLLEMETFKEYRVAFEGLTEIKNRKEKKAFAKLTVEQQKEEMHNRFISYIREIEMYKLYFFMLAYTNSQPVIIVRTPTSSADMKKYLGYEWSSAKGSEGIKYIGVKVDDEENSISKNKGINSIKTPLFNPQDLNDENKINSIIRNNFLGANVDIPDDLTKYVSKANLVDLMSFGKALFDMTISLVPESKADIESKYSLVSIKDVCEIKVGGDKPEKFSETKTSELSIPVYSNGVTDDGLLGYTDKATIFEECVTVSARGTIGFVRLRTSPFLPIVRLIVAIPNKEKILVEYLEAVLNLIDIKSTGAIQSQLTSPDFGQIKIPVPPIDTQRNMINECKRIEEQIDNIRKSIKDYEGKTKQIFNDLSIMGSNISYRRLDESLVIMNKYSINPEVTPTKEYIYVDINSIDNGTGKIDYSKRILGNNAPSRARRKASSNSTIISTVRPYLKGFAYIEEEKTDVIFSTGFAILKSADKNVLLDKWIYLNFMYSEDLMEQMKVAMPKGQYPSINSGDIRNFKIYLPTIQEQILIIDTTNRYHEEIASLENKIISLENAKKDFLNMSLR